MKTKPMNLDGQYKSAEYSSAILNILKQSGKVIESKICGDSMGASIPNNAIIKVEPIQAQVWKVGQVIVYLSGKSLVAHRITYVGSGRLKDIIITRGDNCLGSDVPVNTNAVLGVVQSYTISGSTHAVPPEFKKKLQQKIFIELTTHTIIMTLHLNRSLARFVTLKFAGLARRLKPV